jgi:hypothetical protein
MSQMRKKIFSLLIGLFLLALIVSPVLAQDYSFAVTAETVTVTITPNGTATIDYSYSFNNNAGAHPIDYVDIGMPNNVFLLSNITADVNGTAITDIQYSTVVSPGLTLGLGSNAIPAGGSGTVHCQVVRVIDVLYPGTAKESEPYASFQFSPNWFDSKYASGAANVTVTIILPDPNGNETRFYPPKNWPGAAGPQAGFTQDNLVFYRWQATNADAHTQYTFGASFPARLVPADEIVQPPPFDLFTWIGEHIAWFWIGFFLLILLVIYRSQLWTRKQQMEYLPPKISIEGHGIKRGLTAVEAAILMEQPLDKILTMILFSVVKKNAAKVVTRDPLKIEAITPQPEGLQVYETDFIKAFDSPLPVGQRQALQNLMIAVVQSVAEKMKGFSLKETVAYYQDMIKRAWDEVEAAGTPDVKSQKYDEYMGWTMVDHDYDDHTRRVFGSGPVFLPLWWGNYDPGFHPASMTSGSTVSPVSTGSIGGGRSSSGTSLPTLPGGSFAASIVNGVQTFSSGVIGDVTGFTGGVTSKTHPAPVATPSSSSYHGGGGGGHSCACACACAGCACACAGGGR